MVDDIEEGIQKDSEFDLDEGCNFGWVLPAWEVVDIHQFQRKRNENASRQRHRNEWEAVALARAKNEVEDRKEAENIEVE
jgi:hypothetical protein